MKIVSAVFLSLLMTPSLGFAANPVPVTNAAPAAESDSPSSINKKSSKGGRMKLEFHKKSRTPKKSNKSAVKKGRNRLGQDQSR